MGRPRKYAILGEPYAERNRKRREQWAAAKENQQSVSCSGVCTVAVTGFSVVEAMAQERNHDVVGFEAQTSMSCNVLHGTKPSKNNAFEICDAVINEPVVESVTKLNSNDEQDLAQERVGISPVDNMHGVESPIVTADHGVESLLYDVPITVETNVSEMEALSDKENRENRFVDSLDIIERELNLNRKMRILYMLDLLNWISVFWCVRKD